MKQNFSIAILFSTILFATISILIITGCKKDTTNPTIDSVQGLWLGTIQNATSGPQPYNLSIKPDGSVYFESLTLNQEHFGVGTWTMIGTKLTCNITTLYGFAYNVGVKQKLTAVFNSASGILSSGKWVNTYPSTATDSGTFSLSKVN